ncbi:hypothetical protein [Sorangium cellulosum]|uniref:hypothetical protein n=1 Tax=Sorangium cellulosum TaxID=56 RepID=UPI0004058386|nr:hypothetical protein [Sorangium cellulosum]
MAEHYELGKDTARAGHFFLRAALHANRRGDGDVSLAHVQRGLRCDVTEDVRLQLYAIHDEGHTWRGDFRAGSTYSEEILRLAPRGSPVWWCGVANKVCRDMILGTPEEEADTLRLVEQLGHVAAPPEAIDMAALYWLGIMDAIRLRCRFEAAERALAHLDALVEPVAATDPVSRGWRDLGHACFDGSTHPFSALRWARAAEQSFKEAGHLRGALFGRLLAGINLRLLGRPDEAEQALCATLGTDFAPYSVVRTACLTEILAGRGALDEAERQAELLVASVAGKDRPMDEGLARWVLADVLLRQGISERAEAEARSGCALLTNVTLYLWPGLVVLAAAQLAQGHAAEALATARHVIQHGRAFSVFASKAALVRLIEAESLHALGEHAAAAAALDNARRHLLARADQIDDPDLRQSFLEGVPEHARTLALTREGLTSRR